MDTASLTHNGILERIKNRMINKKVYTEPTDNARSKTVGKNVPFYITFWIYSICNAKKLVSRFIVT